MTTQSARPPLVMKHLRPLMTQCLPSLRQVVRMPATSLPAPGSVSPYAPQCSPGCLKTPKKRSFCSAVPVNCTGGPPSPGPGSDMSTLMSPHAISSPPMSAEAVLLRLALLVLRFAGIAALAAVLLGHFAARHHGAHVREPQHELVGDAMVLVGLQRDRAHHVLGELVHHLLHLGLLRRELEIDHLPRS